MRPLERALSSLSVARVSGLRIGLQSRSAPLLHLYILRLLVLLVLLEQRRRWRLQLPTVWTVAASGAEEHLGTATVDDLDVRFVFTESPRRVRHTSSLEKKVNRVLRSMCVK